MELQSRSIRLKEYDCHTRVTIHTENDFLLTLMAFVSESNKIAIPRTDLCALFYLLRPRQRRRLCRYDDVSGALV